MLILQEIISCKLRKVCDDTVRDLKPIVEDCASNKSISCNSKVAERVVFVIENVPDHKKLQKISRSKVISQLFL